MVVEVVSEDSVTSLMTSRMWVAVWGEAGRGGKGKGEDGGDTSVVSEKRRLVRLLLLVAGEREIVTETGRHFYIAW